MRVSKMRDVTRAKIPSLCGAIWRTILTFYASQGVWVNCYHIHQKSLNFIYPFKLYSNFTNKNASWLHFSWATQYIRLKRTRVQHMCVKWNNIVRGMSQIWPGHTNTASVFSRWCCQGCRQLADNTMSPGAWQQRQQLQRQLLLIQLPQLLQQLNHYNTNHNEKCARRRCKHYALAVVRRAKNFAPLQTSFPGGGHDGQNLISWTDHPLPHPSQKSYFHQCR